MESNDAKDAEIARLRELLRLTIPYVEFHLPAPAYLKPGPHSPKELAVSREHRDFLWSHAQYIRDLIAAALAPRVELELIE